MAENTKIEWCSHTFNPWIGCQKVSEGCRNCYAETETFARVERSGGRELWGPNGERHVTGESYWKQPLKWNRQAEEPCFLCGDKSAQCECGNKRRQRVFCASLADVFEDRLDLVEPRHRLFDVIDRTPNLDWLLVTKRPENLNAMLPWTSEHAGEYGERYWSNVWLGTSVENRKHGLPRVDVLRRTPAGVRFLSCEPLLEDLGEVDLTGIHWVIVGGESGADARPMDTRWATNLRDQCKAAGIAFFMKQMSACANKTYKDFDRFPPHLRVREFPR